MRGKKTAALILAVMTAVGLLAGCGASGGTNEPETAVEENVPAAEQDEQQEPETVTQDAGEEQAQSESETAPEPEEEPDEFAGLPASYNILIGNTEPSFFYADYLDNPTLSYLLEKEWNGKEITLKVDALPDGSQQDAMNTLIATGEYQDLIPVSYCADSPAALYEDGVLLDVGQYLKYMPNYSAWLDSHPDLASQMYVNTSDGRKMLQLYIVCDVPEDFWGGYLYRRDWIVKYGKNPSTGAAFSGKYTNDAKDSWEDDVVFPSYYDDDLRAFVQKNIDPDWEGGDPIFISDWEWMLDIFAEALEKEGITDGYAMQLPYRGSNGNGMLESGFGGGCGSFYLDEDGVCRNGYTSEHQRAFLTCLATWYKNGWIDRTFDEKTSDALFWKVDIPSVYAGKVGCWYGQQSAVGSLLESAENAATEGICVYGAAYPVNDIYGSADEQMKLPDTYFTTANMVQNGMALTNKLEGKDIATLLTFLDDFYTEEGGLLHSKGFSKDEQAQLQNAFYNEYGLQDGAYDFEERDGEKWILKNPAIELTDGLQSAAACGRIACGININDHVDMGYTDVLQHAQDEWNRYANTGTIPGLVTGQLNEEQNEFTSLMNSNLLTATAVWLPQFIKGDLDIENDADWQKWCDEVGAQQPEKYVDYINEVLGN